MNTYVALLRGVNVGGKNKVPMNELYSSFVGLGHANVTTYIQSGNVVFGSRSNVAAKLAQSIEDQIENTFGLKVKVLLRTAADFDDLIMSNPFLTPERDVSRMMVVFLNDLPTDEMIASLDPQRSPPDEFIVRGREIFAYCPNGFGTSKLSIDYFERRLGTRATARNWNTVVKLAALAADGRRRPS